jgi:hypothetical protein
LLTEIAARPPFYFRHSFSFFVSPPICDSRHQKEQATTTMVIRNKDDEDGGVTRFQEMTLLDDMERLKIPRHKITLSMLTKLNTEKYNFYFPRKIFHNKLWNYKRKTIEGYAAALAFHNITMGPATIRELNGILDSVDDVNLFEEVNNKVIDEVNDVPPSNHSSPAASITSTTTAASLRSQSTVTSSSNNSCSTSSSTPISTNLNCPSSSRGSAGLNNPVDLNQELENLSQKLSHISLKGSPAPPSCNFSTKRNDNKPSHSSTKHNNDMSAYISSPPDTPQHSVPSSPAPPSTKKHSNKTPSVSTPPRTIHTPSVAAPMSSHSGFPVPSLYDSSARTTITIDQSAFDHDEDDVDYEGSERHPFISLINTKVPERNRDGFHGHAVTLKRSGPNGDEYHYESVVVTKTGNSADIADMDLWKATIPQKGDLPYMADHDYVGRSVLVVIPALDMLQRDANKLMEGHDGEPCQRTKEAFQATTTRYNEYGSNGETHGEHPHQKKYFLLIFEKAVDFSYLSHDSNCHSVETHSNIATFKKDHRDLWDKIVNTIQQDMTNAYWEVPFVGGRTKVVKKMTPKKQTAAQRKAERDAAKLKAPKHSMEDSF